MAGNAETYDDLSDDELRELLTQKDEVIKNLRRKLKSEPKDAEPEPNTGRKAALRKSSRRALAQARELLNSGKLNSAERAEVESVASECARVLGIPVEQALGSAANRPGLPPRHMLVAAGLISPTAMVSETTADGVLRLNTAMTPKQARARHEELQRELSR